MKTAVFVKALTVSLTQEVFQQISEITDRQRISMAELVMAACERALTGFNISK